MMKISRTEVERMAELARLELTGQEIEDLQRDLSEILEYVDQLNQLDTTGVPPTAHALVGRDVLREDEAEPSMPQEDTLANAPHVQDGFFRVHAVFEKAEEQ